MSHIQLNIEDVRPFLNEQPELLQKQVKKIHKMIHEKTGRGNDYLG